MTSCPVCGHPIAEPSNFCSNCGAKLSTASAVQDTTRIFPALVDDVGMDTLSPDDERAIAALPAGSALLIVSRGARGERFVIDADTTTVGRHPNAGIFLDDATVSRQHAEFLRKDGGLYIRDLGSLNGTYVNRKPVDAEVRLRTGDELQIGKFKMTCFVSARDLS